MASFTFPNQRQVRIHREPIESDFLGIKNENWQAASRDLGAHGLRLYLYLAANANNFMLALSPAAVRQAIGMARSTYSDYFQILLEKGYIVANSKGSFDFYERPRPADNFNENEVSSAGHDDKNGSSAGFQNPTGGQECPQNNREINNIENGRNKSINKDVNIRSEYPRRDDVFIF